MILDKIKVDNTTYDIGVDYSNISNAPTNLSDFNNDEGYIDNTVDDLQNYKKSNELVVKLSLELDPTTFKLKGILKDSRDNVIFTSNEIDLPLETVVVSADYDAQTKELVITLVSGATTRVSIADLVSGLVSTSDLSTALSNYYTKGQIDSFLADIYTKSQVYTKGEVDSAISTAENSAKGYADTVSSTAENNAKSYADTKSSTAETNAKTYADGVGTNAVSTANSYTDSVASGKQNIMQFTTMPTASADYVGKVVQYVGTTTQDYTNGYFYVGTTDDGDQVTYGWANVNVQSLNGYLKNNQNYTISGTYTYSILPVSSVVPTTNTQLVNKQYVDDAIASAITTALEGEY